MTGRTRLVVLVALAACWAAAPARSEDLTLMDWNLLNYPGSDGLARAPHFRTVLGAVGPDLLVVQEIQTQSGVNHFLTNVLEVLEPGAWQAGPFHDSYDTDRALFLRAGCAEVIDWGWLDTALRDINWWQLRLTATGEELRVYTLHLKASQGYEEDRLAECEILRAALAGLNDGLPYLVAGDYNLYTASEPAYQHLTASGEGELLDPIEQEGAWHDNALYAPVHTQSTRTASFGGGATGGLDDRFDFILVSAEFLDGEDLELLPESYTAYGNDGQHLNQSIIQGGNNAVPYEVAEALHLSSDHLPLFATLRGETASLVVELPSGGPWLTAGPALADGPALLRFGLPRASRVELAIFDASGRVVTRWAGAERTAGAYEWRWDGNSSSGAPAGSGVYYARLDTDGATRVARIVRVR